MQWGEPGRREPTNSTPLSFLGVDGRWRQLSTRQLGEGNGYLRTIGLSPDGSMGVFYLRRKTVLLDFGSGRTRLLVRRIGMFTSWSPDSRWLALVDIQQPGIRIFDRRDRQIDELPIDAGKGPFFIADDGSVVVGKSPRPGADGKIWFTVYPPGTSTGVVSYCAIPAGYPPAMVAKGYVGIKHFDGRHLWFGGLVDRQKYVTRETVIDLGAGEVIQDVLTRGAGPSIDSWVKPGVFATSAAGKPGYLYAVDTDEGEFTRISGQLEFFPNQGGYENHPSSDYASDLVLKKAD